MIAEPAYAGIETEGRASARPRRAEARLSGMRAARSPLQINRLALNKLSDEIFQRDDASGFLAAIDYCSKADPRGAETAHYPIGGFGFGGGDDTAHVMAQRMRQFSVEKNVVNIDQAERLSVVGENGKSIDARFLARLQ